MPVGDIVSYHGQLRRVFKTDRNVRTLTLQSWAGVQEEVADDDPSLVLYAQPGLSWPFTKVPVKGPKAGRVLRVTRGQGRHMETLEPYRDWVMPDIVRSGGPIFFHPGLKLHLGEVLVAHFQSGSMGRISIGPQFRTVVDRRKAAEPPSPEPPKNFYAMLDDE